jgi:ABC-type uncharacterized transport system permease subunit
MLHFASTIKLLCEIVGLCLVGQGVLYILAGASREKNLPYQLLRTVTSPVIRALRVITPRFVLDRHMGLLAFFVVFMLWFWAGQTKLVLCLTEHQQNPLCAGMLEKYQERQLQRQQGQ